MEEWNKLAAVLGTVSWEKQEYEKLFAGRLKLFKHSWLCWSSERGVTPVNCKICCWCCHQDTCSGIQIIMNKSTLGIWYSLLLSTYFFPNELIAAPGIDSFPATGKLQQFSFPRVLYFYIVGIVFSIFFFVVYTVIMISLVFVCRCLSPIKLGEPIMYSLP